MQSGATNSKMSKPTSLDEFQHQQQQKQSLNVRRKEYIIQDMDYPLYVQKQKFYNKMSFDTRKRDKCCEAGEV